ncbi:MAG: hypothetical protein ACKVXR_14370 [Planctomycetota bacterium]
MSIAQPASQQEVLMFSRIKLPALCLSLLAVLAPASRADGFGISFFKSSKHGAISVGYSNGPGATRACAPVDRTPYRHARWVPGHYRTVRERVWVPGFVQRVWIEPRYGWRRDSCGRVYRERISGGHYERVEQPGHYEYRDAQVWVNGSWRTG